MHQNLLKTISYPEDLRKLSKEQLPELAQELRDLIIATVATKEGHLGASLGVVELTIALHYVFNTPEDLLVWDVGHQAYGHKILTGRRDQFHTNRQLGGISGFPKRKESKYDAFGTGHSSTAISAVLGMAIASKLQGKHNKQHIAVVGDASIASGMAFEGLNHAGVTDTNVLVILNDNAIGIDPSIGALKQYLTHVKEGKNDKDNIFEALNFNYEGPLDGHNLPLLIDTLDKLKGIKGPKLLHIRTTKGKGLKQAEEEPVVYHAPGKFNKTTGELAPKSTEKLPPKYQDVFGHTLVELAQKNSKIMGITPAMPTGSSLKYMMQAFPDRAFDVGIAEQHAVTLAAGLATQGMVVFCNIYSTFMQRAYDQLIHDVALQNLPVIFCLDRAGLVGEDGATHHGIFDMAYLRCIPNLQIFAPMNEEELRNIMYTAQQGTESPIVIRYPRGRGTTINWKTPFQKIRLGSSRQLQQGKQIAILTIGHIGNSITRIIQNLSAAEQEQLGHYDMRFVSPLDEKQLHQIAKHYSHIIIVEDGCIAGGFGSAVLEFLNTHGYKLPVKTFGIPPKFIDHGTIFELQKLIKLDPDTITNYIKTTLNNAQSP